jgi:hypothetical protein
MNFIRKSHPWNSNSRDNKKNNRINRNDRGYRVCITYPFFNRRNSPLGLDVGDEGTGIDLKACHNDHRGHDGDRKSIDHSHHMNHSHRKRANWRRASGQESPRKQQSIVKEAQSSIE